jgi:hypothetical protein
LGGVLKIQRRSTIGSTMALAEPIETTGTWLSFATGTIGMVVGVVPPPMMTVTRSSSISRRATTTALASFDSLSYGISRIGTPLTPPPALSVSASSVMASSWLWPQTEAGPESSRLTPTTSSPDVFATVSGEGVGAASAAASALALVVGRAAVIAPVGADATF